MASAMYSFISFNPKLVRLEASGFDPDDDLTITSSFNPKLVRLEVNVSVYSLSLVCVSIPNWFD